MLAFHGECLSHQLIKFHRHNSISPGTWITSPQVRALTVSSYPSPRAGVIGKEAHTHSIVPKASLLVTEPPSSLPHPSTSPEARSTSRTGGRIKHRAPQRCYSQPVSDSGGEKGRPLGRWKQKVSLILLQLPSISKLEKLRKANTLIAEGSSLTGRLCGQWGGRSREA